MKFFLTLFMVYQMDFANWSKCAWRRMFWGANLDAVLQNLTETPAPTMANEGHNEGLGINQYALGSIAKGYVDLWCVWQADDTAEAIIGIKIHAPIQVFGIGWKPTWSVCTNTNEMQKHTTVEPVWKDIEPLKQTTPFKATLPGNHSVTITPHPAHSSISIGCQIN